MHVQRISGLLLLPAVFALSGCGYVHLGRPPAPVITTIIADAKLHEENATLHREKSLLQQELALTRAQGEALRSALQNRAADGDTSQRLVDQLNRTTRELAALRTSYAQLQLDKSQSVASADPIHLKTKLGATEEQLAAALRNYTQLQQEIARLRGEVVRVRTENLALGEQVKVATARNERAQAAIEQLNRDLLAQKYARLRAEQDAETLRTALHANGPAASPLAQQRTGAAADARSLVPDNGNEGPVAPPFTNAAKRTVVIDPNARVRINLDAAAPSARAVATPASPPSAAPNAPVDLPASAAASASEAAPTTSAITTPTTAATSVAAAPASRPAARMHTVDGGDTLARISTRYYGTAGRWSVIVAANRDVLGDSNTLVIGRTLRIP